MNKLEHNKKAQELLADADIANSNPTPWSFEWDGQAPPMILDANGGVVAVLSTGTISGAYDTKAIIANASRILNKSN